MRRIPGASGGATPPARWCPRRRDGRPRRPRGGSRTARRTTPVPTRGGVGGPVRLREIDDKPLMLAALRHLPVLPMGESSAGGAGSGRGHAGRLAGRGPAALRPSAAAGREGGIATALTRGDPTGGGADQRLGAGDAAVDRSAGTATSCRDWRDGDSRQGGCARGMGEGISLDPRACPTCPTGRIPPTRSGIPASVAGTAGGWSFRPRTSAGSRAARAGRARCFARRDSARPAGRRHGRRGPSPPRRWSPSARSGRARRRRGR